ncbi:hypothetical protein ALO83_104076 [Pseudomonas cannabina pv. alisalensis]|uniref:Uncharacterized protein n=1 Tax=Pseudomonas cannabina TaxID=86840 RepID=A0A3M3QLJ3_PSECA|nr:hypothetical protein ALO83_104076 [Pseudomonas cannabina pv. alisalensis]RMN76355.1 hypothetical protein ALQ52_104814 [Pseudomonas cannabina pv. alisalensis]RMN84831.1 hypothetical protein ALQ53_103806 [Pseudomonas cannabina]RMN95621.1 hypothetical protein ALQ51_102384 [Pseudomonas cannabina]
MISENTIETEFMQYPGLTVIGYYSGQFALLEILNIDRPYFIGQAHRRIIQLTSPHFASRIFPAGDTPRRRWMSIQEMPIFSHLDCVLVELSV